MTINFILSHNPLTATVRKGSQHFKSRVKTVFKRIASSVKMRSHRLPSSPVISSPELLDLPGYNSSVALSLSSPIQIARFLYAAKVTVRLAL